MRVSGPDAFAVAGAVAGRVPTSEDAGRFFRCTFRGFGGRVLDDGLMLVFAAPRSYTGEDAVEFHTHGGTVAPRRVLEACFAAGARLARRGEFTLRAFLNGKLDLSAAEATIDLVDAKTDRSADDAVARLTGAGSRRFNALYEEALDISVALEHSLDVSEDELPASFMDGLAERLRALLARVRELAATAREGKILREGALVVLAGPPNAGKSSLLNALLGERRAIVGDVAGTTRDSIEEWMEMGGWPVRLTDTAGLREADDAVEAEGVARARALADRADLVVALDCCIPGALLVHAKCDLGRGEGLNVSAVTGEGLEELKSAVAARLETLAARGDEVAAGDVTTRQRELLEEAATALEDHVRTLDPVLAAEGARRAADALGRIVGRTYSADLLDSLFSRFCVGK